ncbi:MAG: gfo/Idh/MocA family oxidoreductase [Acidobacteria bacterium]|nr:MAG: gfo/Idh/MocA family oxidoreductase [Acidobacteriota bacterium]
MAEPRLRFAAIGLNHGHINGQVQMVQRGGGELVSFFAPEPDLAASFASRYPQVKRAGSEKEILEDPSIQLVVSASIPNERAPLGIRVMEHGKDFMADKPGFTTLDQLAKARKVQQQTKRIYSVCYSERFGNAATVKAGELIREGAIGQVIQTLGLGPHQTNLKTRPDWFFKKESYGGILCDIGSHQVDQFLYFTDSRSAEVVSSQVANYHHPEYLGLEDFGDMNVRSDRATGYIRVDWFTPSGLGSWGDGRLILLGTDGYIEVRKNIDIMGKPGGNHLFLVNNKGKQYLDCDGTVLPYGQQLVDDVLNRTETAMTQAHCFLASQLALEAEAKAARLGHLKS